MKVMNCREMGVNIAKIRSMVEDFREKFESGDTEVLWKMKESIETLKKEIEFNESNIALRDEIAREHGYLFVGKFTRSGIARAKKDMNTWFLINMKGVQISQNCSIINPFDGNFASYQLPTDKSGLNKYGYFAQNGKDIEGVLANSDGNFLRVNNDIKGKYFINDQGEKINDQFYADTAIYFKEGFAWVSKYDEEGQKYQTYVKTNGEETDFGKFRSCDSFKKGFVGVETLDNHYKLLNTEGKVILELKGVRIEESGGDTAIVSYRGIGTEGGYNFLKPDGTLIFDEWFDKVGDMNDGLAWVKKDGKWFIAKRDDNLRKIELDDQDFSNININDPNVQTPSFSEGLSILEVSRESKNWHSVVVDTEGNKVFEVAGKFVGNFHDGLAMFMLVNKRRVLVDKNGEISREYDYIDTHPKFMTARDERGTFILDKTGKPLVGPFEHIWYNKTSCGRGSFAIQDSANFILDDDLKKVRENFFSVSNASDDLYQVTGEDGKYFWIDRHGNEVFKAESDEPEEDE